MAIDSVGLIDAVASHAKTLGFFEAVNGHEPQNPPSNGLSCAIWLQSISPVTSSGLASTSAAITLNVRLYTPIIQEPADIMDPNMISATDALLRAYTGDFTLGGLVRQVDLMGTRHVTGQGRGLFCEAGYMEQNNRIYRIMTINLQLILNDVWDQAP